MKQKIIIFLLLLSSALSALAQNATNVRVRQEGEEIIITYDLNKKSDVHVYISTKEHNQYRELIAVRGAVGKNISAGENLKIIWHPLNEQSEFVVQNVRFKVEAENAYDRYVRPGKQGGKNTETFLVGEVGISPTSQIGGGGMIGQTYSGFGWYIKARSNFQFPNIQTNIDCDARGIINGTLPFYSGNKISNEWIIDAGFVWDISETYNSVINNRFNTFGIYIGTGYGKRELYWELSDGQWARYTPTSHKGLSLDFGLLGSIYGLTLATGINTIGFQYVEFELGIGWMF